MFNISLKKNQQFFKPVTEQTIECSIYVSLEMWIYVSILL